jgi:hypothetical protein
MKNTSSSVTAGIGFRTTVARLISCMMHWLFIICQDFSPDDPCQHVGYQDLWILFYFVKPKMWCFQNCLDSFCDGYDQSCLGSDFGVVNLLSLGLDHLVLLGVPPCIKILLNQAEVWWDLSEAHTCHSNACTDADDVVGHRSIYINDAPPMLLRVLFSIANFMQLSILLIQCIMLSLYSYCCLERTLENSYTKPKRYTSIHDMLSMPNWTKFTLSSIVLPLSPLTQI